MPAKKRSNVLGTSAAVVATALVGASASSGADDPWFQELRKPSFQPPPIAFPIVWPILYAAIAVAGVQTLDALEQPGRGDQAAAYRRALGVNLSLNAAWTWLFFKARRPLVATVESAVLTGTTVDLLRRGRTAAPRAQLLLLPYLAWTVFATALTGRISRLNRGRTR